MTPQASGIARKKRRFTHRGPAFRRLCSEQLEPRLLLSCNGSNDENIVATLDGQPASDGFVAPQICLLLDDELSDPDLASVYSLIPLGVAGDTARYELRLDYTPVGAEQMVFFSETVLRTFPPLGLLTPQLNTSLECGDPSPLCVFLSSCSIAKDTSP